MQPHMKMKGLIRYREYTLPIHNPEIWKQIFPEKKLCGRSPNFHIHVSMSDLYIPTNGLSILLQENMWTDLGIYKSPTDT